MTNPYSNPSLPFRQAQSNPSGVVSWQALKDMNDAITAAFDTIALLSGIQEDVWASWDVVKQASTLPKGFNIRITDPTGCDKITVFCEEPNQVRSEGEGYIQGEITINPVIGITFKNLSAGVVSVADNLTFDNAATAEVLSISGTILLKYSNLAGAKTVGDHVTGTDTGFTGVIASTGTGFLVITVTGGDPFAAYGETEITITETTEVGDVDEIDYTVSARLTLGDAVSAISFTDDDTAETASITGLSGNIITTGQTISGGTSSATALITTYSGSGYDVAVATIDNVAGTFQLDEALSTPGGGSAFAGGVSKASDTIAGWHFMFYNWLTNTASTYVA